MDFLPIVWSVHFFGEAFISLGIFGLIAAIVQHRRIVKRIKHGEFVYTEHLPVAMITAIILLLIGLFGFIAVLL